MGDDQVTALAVHGNYMAWDALEGFGVFFFHRPLGKLYLAASFF